MDFIVWVLCEQDARGLRGCTLEALGEARSLADGLTGRVHAVLVGADTGPLIEPVRQQDVDAVYRLEHPLLTPHRTEAWMIALESFFAQQQSGLVLASDTALGRELAPRLAARISCPVVTGCIWVKPGPARDIRMIRPMHAGRFQTTYSFPPGPWLVASLRPDVVGTVKPVRCRTAEIIECEPGLPDEQMFIKEIEWIPGDPRRISLAEAERIVAGGRGTGGPDGWQAVEDVADALGAAVGGSRAAMDLGCVSRDRMIGQTGTSVKPRLYLAAGISGVQHHMAGVQTEHLIAINTDRNAGIFWQAALGIIGDLQAILPKLAEKIRALRASREKGGAA